MNTASKLPSLERHALEKAHYESILAHNYASSHILHMVRTLADKIETPITSFSVLHNIYSGRTTIDCGVQYLTLPYEEVLSMPSCEISYHGKIRAERVVWSGCAYFTFLYEAKIPPSDITLLGALGHVKYYQPPVEVQISC